MRIVRDVFVGLGLLALSACSLSTTEFASVDIGNTQIPPTAVPVVVESAPTALPFDGADAPDALPPQPAPLIVTDASCTATEVNSNPLNIRVLPDLNAPAEGSFFITLPVTGYTPDNFGWYRVETSFGRQGRVPAATVMLSSTGCDPIFAYLNG